MLYDLLYPLAGEIGVFNLFRYLTFRTGGALMTALLLSFLFGPAMIRMLKHYQPGGQPIREDGPQSHIITKAGTPTMGGFMILAGIVAGTLLWADLSNRYVWAVLLITLGFGLVGFADDYLKVTKRNSRGVPGKIKLACQIVIALFAVAWIGIIADPAQAQMLAIPFFKNVLLDLGWLFIPMAVFVIVGASNAVNLTDGLDGLAIMPVMIAAASFAFISYLVGHAVYAEYLQILAVPGAGELSVFAGAIVGAGLGFLWFNAPPAMVMMGDTGSLSLGGALGGIAVVTKHEIVLALSLIHI